MSELRMESHRQTVASQVNPGGLASPSRFTGMRIHFIGIGGCGMSGLARMLLDHGALVSGSEPKPNPSTFALIRAGAKISRDQLGELLDPGVDMVVRTAAISDSNVEYQAARAIGLKQIKYAEMLGMVMRERLGVAVAGTHGKSTTTAMISYALLHAGADPSFVVGGTAPQLGGGSRSGAGRAFVVEACEFDRSFHHLHPAVALIANIEEDHLDYYKDIEDIVDSFRHFARLVPEDGLILANGRDARVMQALAGLNTPIEMVGLSTTGINEFLWTTRITGIEQGCYRGEAHYKGRGLGELRLQVAGEHNLFNATMALAACVACGVEAERAIEGLNDFLGVDRRMTEMGRRNGAVIVDDYGHHPTEIRVTLEALRGRYSPRRLYCVFQPHQHSRTRFLLDDFASSFAAADETVVPDIYFVRDSESERQRVSSKDLVERINANGQQASHLETFEQIIAYLTERIGPGDLVVTMGAGNVWEIGQRLASD